MRYWCRRVIWLALAVLLSRSVGAVAQDVGVLEGQIVNGTAGGAEITSGLPVTLHVFDGETEVSLLEASSDDEGRFRFEGLSAESHLEYQPEVVYLGVTYSPSEPLQFEAGETSLETTIRVYETTDDESVLKLSSVHFIAQSFGQALRISEIHLFGNSGDRTYVGHELDSAPDRVVTALIPLPANAVGLSFEADNAEERFVVLDDRAYDTEPIPPGEESLLVFFSYHLMVNSDVIRLDRQFAYPVDSLSGLAAQPGLEIQSQGLAAMGPQVFQDQQYQLYATENLAADAALVIDLIPTEAAVTDTMPGTSTTASQNATGGTPGGSQGLLGVLGAGLAVLAVVGAVGYTLMGRRTGSVRMRAADLAAHPEASRLLEDLADLEEAYQAGSVGETSYESARAAKLRAIQSIWK